MNSEAFNKKVLSYISGGAVEGALQALADYLKPGKFTGSSFEKIPVADQFSITAEDIVAVSMLSVDIPARCSEWILGTGQQSIRYLLEQIPLDADITTFESLTERTGPTWQLWDLLINFSGMGRTKTSKLLARKRSRLIPIYDSVVANALGIERTDNDWELWQRFMKDVGVSEFRNAVQNTHAQYLSDLRIIDIVIWMKEQGWKYVSDDDV